MDLRNPLSQRCIGECPLRWASLSPGVVPTGGDTQKSAHPGYRVLGLIRSHELEDPESVSRANQAAAFANISRSIFSWRFSRRSLLSSSRSSVVRPSSRRPSSRSACRTQARIDTGDGPNSLARSAGFPPARTSSTICCRNSSGYGGRVLPMALSFRPPPPPVELWKTGPLPRFPQPPQSRRRRKPSSVHHTGAPPLFSEADAAADDCRC